MGSTAYRVKASWGDGSASYFYFDTAEEARRFSPDRAKPVYGLISGAFIGYKTASRVTLQKRGPRGGYSSMREHSSAEEQVGGAPLIGSGGSIPPASTNLETNLNRMRTQ